jgi:mRNA-degrading endonuclease RelE of RelBE toxin-antitoxin system
MYNVQFTTTAWKQYAELSEEKTIRAVNKAITQITRGVVQGRRKLANRENTYRIHAGNYRVLYKITSSQCIITGIVKKDKKSYK